MKVFFDSQTFVNQRYGGISRYFCELINGINKTEEHQAHLSLLWSNNVHVKDYCINSLNYPFETKHRLLSKTNEIFNKLDSLISSYDIYHATYFNDFLINDKNKKSSVTTFYDMTYERLSVKFKELSDDNEVVRRKKEIASKVNHIISISENTKQDIVNYLNIDPKKISVIPLASSMGNQVDRIGERLIKEQYILFVGNRSGYKNFDLFIESIVDILKKYNVCLICAGGGELSTLELRKISDLGLGSLIRYYSINDLLLGNLYKYAEAFVFPSLYEGFGIPILEAFSCKCPCILSDTSSFPEVAGEAAFYFNPYQKDSIKYSIEKVLADNELKKFLVQRGTERLKQFSWKNTVEKTLDTYKLIS